MNQLLWLPVRKKYWFQHQLWDGTYTISDWLDLIEQIPEFEKDFIALIQGLTGNRI